MLRLVGRTAGAIGGWLGPAVGDALRLTFDADRVEALSSERDGLWRRLEGASFLSDDEKRAAVGYSPRGDPPAPEG